jgi:hypothetical protein
VDRGFRTRHRPIVGGAGPGTLMDG